MFFIEKKNFKLLKYTFKLSNITFFSKKKKFLKLLLKKNNFIRLYFLFSSVTKNIKFLFNILYTFFKNLWYLTNNYLNSNKVVYYTLLKNIFQKYKIFLLKNENNNKIINHNLVVYYPNSILTESSFIYSNSIMNNFFFYINFEKYFFKKILNSSKGNTLISNKYFINSILFKKNNYQYSKFKLNFLRIQRRYNKRRYSKVRVVSRNSFFAGISLSSIFIGILWGGTIKNIDWISTKIIVIDINFILFVSIFYFIFRIYCIKNPNVYIRKKNKINIINNLHNFFILKLFK